GAGTTAARGGGAMVTGGSSTSSSTLTASSDPPGRSTVSHAPAPSAVHAYGVSGAPGGVAEAATVTTATAGRSGASTHTRAPSARSVPGRGAAGGGSTSVISAKAQRTRWPDSRSVTGAGPPSPRSRRCWVTAGRSGAVETVRTAAQPGPLRVHSGRPSGSRPTAVGPALGGSSQRRNPDHSSVIHWR